MRDKPHSNHRLDWPGGIVPEWAKPQGNPNKQRFRKGKGGGSGGAGGNRGGKRERLQKVMAQSGHGSRRNIEILIAQGHLTINGQVAKLGDLVGPGDRVKLDGHPISMRYGDPLPQVLLYHKPEGEIVTRDDPEGRATVFEKLPKVHGGRWVSVGRLDLNTGGLLIFTTSGELANRLMHPRFEVEREYAVRLLGELTEESAKKLLEGIDIEGDLCKFDSIEDRGGEGANHWYHVVLREGRNREVRKMCEAVGLVVSRLMRVRYGPVELPSFVKRGMMHEMEEQDVYKLMEFAGLREAEPVPAPGEAPAEEEEDDGQLKFLARIDAQGTAPRAFQGPGQGPGRPPRGQGQPFQGPRGGNGPRQGQGHGPQQGKKNWKNRPKGQRGGQGPRPQGQPPAIPGTEGAIPPEALADLQAMDPDAQPNFLPGAPGPAQPGQPAGPRAKRHRNRRRKGKGVGQGPQGGSPGQQGPREARDSQEPRAPHSVREAQDPRPPQQARENREPQDPRPPQQVRESREAQDPRPPQIQQPKASRDDEQPTSNENRRPY